MERWPAYGVRYNHTCYHHVGNDYDNDCFIIDNYVNDDDNNNGISRVSKVSRISSNK